jgi:hypothetical protein
MIQGQFCRGKFIAAIVAETSGNSVPPPLGTAQVTGFLPFTAKLFFRNVCKEIHRDQDTEYGDRNTAKTYTKRLSCRLFFLRKLQLSGKDD